MKIEEAIRKILKDERITQAELSEKLGKKQQSIAMYLRNANGMRIDTAVQMVNACGYDVMIVKRGDMDKRIIIGDGEDVQSPADTEDNEEERIRRIVREELQKGVNGQ